MRAIATLLAVLFVYCSTLEVVTRLGLSRISLIQRRFHDDYRAAVSLRPEGSDPPTILFAGNSLLLAAVDRSLLQKELAPNYRLLMLPVENTQYEDWYFALRRLFAEGSRPSVVAVCLSTRHLISHATDGEYFSHYLMQERDLLAVKRESQIDNTMTSNYFFAHQSRWLGSRVQIRNWLLQEIMPNLDQLIGFFPGNPPPMPPPDVVVTLGLPHLRKMDELCRANHARILLVVPPTLNVHDASAVLQTAAAREGITVLVPARPGEIGRDGFSDGFHLNQHGAAQFTGRLGPALLRALSSR
jgi:hypothetical protein